MAEERRVGKNAVRGLKPAGGGRRSTGAGAPEIRKPKPEAVSPARLAAADVLYRVGEGKGHSDELLHATGPEAALEGLSEQDRRLATALVLGVLRWQIALDARVRRHLTRPDDEISPVVRIALRLGAFQLLHMDRVPAHAALSESVALARVGGEERATGMANAVLRRVAEEPKDEAPVARVFERPSVFAERLGHPAWLAERWAKTYGAETARRICEAGQREPESVPAEGAVPAMDAGSRLVAELAVTAAPMVDDRPLRVWDCCAAPGGKTALMATRLQERGPIEVLATDVNARRLRGMEARLAGLAASAGEGGPVRLRLADARELPADEGEFDLVLCDVPCSGTGTLARNPEIRLRLEESDFVRQAERQREILGAALERVGEGGRLVYSTCSLEPEECEAVVDAVLAGLEGWRRVEVSGLGGVPAEAVRAGALRTVPGVQAGDGFYAAVLERAALVREQEPDGLGAEDAVSGLGHLAGDEAAG